MKITIELPDAEANDLNIFCDILRNLSVQLSSLLDGLERIPTCNMEYQESMRPYIGMLIEKTDSYECPVRKNSLGLLSGMVLRNKKLLPYDGSRVNVLEYTDHIIVFTLEGRHIVSLYKDRFCSE